MSFRRSSESPAPIQQPSATKEEEEIANCLHEPPNLRAGEEVPLPEVPLPGGPGRNRRSPRTLERAGDHLVPEQAGETEAGHGRAEEGRGIGQDPDRSQILPGERPGPGHSQEEERAEPLGRGEELRRPELSHSCRFLREIIRQRTGSRCEMRKKRKKRSKNTRTSQLRL